MARTDEGAVRDAIETTLTNPQVTAFIDDASGWIDAQLADKGLTAATLTLVEKYLACHLITLRDPRIKSGKFGDTSETYQRDGEVTEYLKMAIALDPSGTVEDAFGDSKQRVRFRVGEGYDPTLDLGVTGP